MSTCVVNIRLSLKRRKVKTSLYKITNAYANAHNIAQQQHTSQTVDLAQHRATGHSNAGPRQLSSSAPILQATWHPGTDHERR